MISPVHDARLCTFFVLRTWIQTSTDVLEREHVHRLTSSWSSSVPLKLSLKLAVDTGRNL